MNLPEELLTKLNYTEEQLVRISKCATIELFNHSYKINVSNFSTKEGIENQINSLPNNIGTIKYLEFIDDTLHLSAYNIDKSTL